ncbi:uncharacterized protein RHOBADRAFT_51965 [Rhodotorula graminis WP1]|uniref:Cell division control protein 14 n=1 Tax=Rhodotorula graminis (strain WP1) TaxID=578459 RepID=A0A194S953_RHOGW|nr:uncharacterized protein RHOBADRAFT_51965 [Rhodotorula graminis WP1]KPV76995.1 hypothetical protein RHOBADRAFT_51965 [Rhodotorula graminis WP1]
MTATSLRLALVAIIDDLLTLNSTDHHTAQALDRLEGVLHPLALADPSSSNKLDRFLDTQDSLDLNLTTVLLQHLARSLGPNHQDSLLVWSNWTRSLRLVQGLLLLHPPSQRLFARRSSFEYLLAILDLARTALPPASPSLASTSTSNPAPLPFPSPVLFPPTPLSSPRLSSQRAPPPPDPRALAATHLALAALDVVLCALVDRPANVRVFEDLDGLAHLVRVLKDKAVAQPVRIKVIELLYFYLLPEANPTSTSSAPDPALASSTSGASALDERILGICGPSGAGASASDATAEALPRLFAETAASFVPQTPTRQRVRRTSSSSAAAASFEPTLSTPRSAIERTPSRAASSATEREPPSPSLSASRSAISAPTTPRALRHQRSQSLTSLRDVGVVGGGERRGAAGPLESPGRLSRYLPPPPASPRAGAPARPAPPPPRPPSPRALHEPRPPRARHSTPSSTTCSSSSSSTATTTTATNLPEPANDCYAFPDPPTASAPSTPRARAQPPSRPSAALEPLPPPQQQQQQPVPSPRRPAQAHRRAQSMLDIVGLGRAPSTSTSGARPPPPPPGPAPRRSSSSSAAAAREPSGPLVERTRAERDARRERERERERHGAMLPPPVPSSASAARPGHVRARSSASSTGTGASTGAVQAAVERLERRASVDEAAVAGRARGRLGSGSSSSSRAGGRGPGAGVGVGVGARAGSGAARAGYDVGSSGSSASAGSARSASTAATTAAYSSSGTEGSGGSAGHWRAGSRPSAASSSSRRPALAAASTRTELEKKELLRRVMPNVDALEDRFRAMGLGLAP